jgi:hemoglobin
MKDETQNLYEQLGSEVGIGKVVEDFYERILADPDLAPYFASVDLTELRRHQVDFLSAATGGPGRYAGRDIRAAHAGLAITGNAFDRVARHLLDSLRGFGVAPGATDQVLRTVSGLRTEIVSS